MTVAAFVASIEFGIQPALFHTANGTPLYAPYPLSVAIPAMVIPHALVASVVEGLVTALVVAYLQRANQPALEIARKQQLTPDINVFARWRAMWIGLAVMVVATPLGLLAPGTAWGEWGAEELAGLGLSFIPKGLAHLSELWSAPLPDYDLAALSNPALAYILSAVLGVALVALLVWLFTILLASRKIQQTEFSK